MRPEILNYLYQHSIDVYVPDYKAFYIAMVAIALTLSTIFAVKRGLPAIKFYVATVLICTVSFLGGRIFFELRNFNHIFTYPFSEVLLSSGTGSVGVYISGIIAAFIILKWMKIDVLAAFDIYAPVMALSLSIGRLGCFMSGCCFGKTTSLPWAVSFPYNSPAYTTQLSAGMITSDFNYSLPVHPTQIYEMLFGMILFFLLLWFGRKKRTDGLSLFIYLTIYAVFRFFIEFLRGDDRGLLFNLSFPQVFTLVLFVFGLLGRAYCNVKSQKTDRGIGLIKNNK